MRNREDSLRLSSIHSHPVTDAPLARPWDAPWPFQPRSICFADDDADGGGDDGGDEAIKASDVQALVDKAVAEATKGLKATNAALKSEKKELAEKLGTFDGLDPEEVQSIMKLFADNEEAQLIKDGKIDDVIAKRTERMAKNHTKALAAKDEEISRLQAELQAKDTNLSSLVIDTQIREAANKAGIVASAVEDALFRGRCVFSLDQETAEPVALNKDGSPQLGKDGKSNLTIGEWFDGMKVEAPHWFPGDKGSGAMGANGERRKQPNPFAKDTKNLTEQARLKRDDPATYDRLRAEAGLPPLN